MTRADTTERVPPFLTHRVKFVSPGIHLVIQGALCQIAGARMKIKMHSRETGAVVIVAVMFVFLATEILGWEEASLSTDQRGRASPGSILSSGKSVSSKTPLKISDVLQVESGGSWWACKIVGLENDGQVKIHYIGWANSWDEIVPRNRLQLDPDAAKKAMATLSSVQTTLNQPEKRAWGPEQALGPPDTTQAGDASTAWASLLANAGPEWLKVGFDQAVTISEIRIRESYNPGAISKVVAIPEDDRAEVVLWEGSDVKTELPKQITVKTDARASRIHLPTADSLCDLVIRANKKVHARWIRIELDTRWKAGWNEIDAVEMIGSDGSRQWASSATASSTYAEPAAQPVASTVWKNRSGDPYDQLTGKQVVVHVEGGGLLKGKLSENNSGTVLLEQGADQRKTVVNKLKIIFLESDAGTD